MAYRLFNVRIFLDEGNRNYVDSQLTRSRYVHQETNELANELQEAKELINQQLLFLF